MGFSCGIVGLPNVGKSTLFNALTSANAAASNYPFCTIDPNIGVVPVPDPRLARIAGIVQPEKVTPTSIEFIDIAGLVRGASRGEGLGNQFLGHIRAVDAIAHLVRCFTDSDVAHVDGEVDPIRDISTIHTELCLADLDSVARAIEKTQKAAKSGEKDPIRRLQDLETIRGALERGMPVRALPEPERDAAPDLHLLTAKPLLFILNVDEGGVGKPNLQADRVRNWAAGEKARVVEVSAKVEAELAQLPPEEQRAFLAEMGLPETGLSRVIRAGYELLDLITFFTTVGKKECRAWTVRRGTKAPQAAGRVHTDFERGFIAVEVAPCEELFRYGSEAALRQHGLVRLEGREYVVRDGDIAQFRFNV